MKKLLPYIIIFILLIGGVAYFIYQYSPTTLEKKESDFAIQDIDAVTKVRLTDTKGHEIILTKKDKKWIVNGKYDVNEPSRELLFTAIQKLETNYRTPAKAEPIVLKDMGNQHNKCEIYLHDEDRPSKVYYVGGPTADGIGTYMIMERDGHMAAHSYVTHIPGIRAYLTGRYYPEIDRWRSVWIFRDDDQDIQSLKLTYHRELQKSFEITRVAGDSFVIANSDGQVLEQPKQKFIHQYLSFYEGLSLETFKNKDTAARDTILPMQPFCTIDLKRLDKTETSVTLYYIPVNEQTRVQFDEQGHKMLYDIEHYYVLMNGKEDFAMVQFYTWGKALRSYQDFFVMPPAVKPQ
jgi:hypothetical protein